MREVRRRLLRWYRRNRRDLPWRRTDDPYAIWISETMLQQTRVDTVIPYYERFLARFPTARTLADAPADDVMEHWAGLGYYRRARNLQAAARVVVDEHGGELPDDLEALLGLPGVGRYTAGAVASIAFDRPAPIVDGNVARVLARLLDLREDVRTPPMQRRLWEEATALATGPSPGDLNQALMELGALVCTPRQPGCTRCPLTGDCRAREAGSAESLPVKSRARKPVAMEASCAWLVRRGRVLVVRRPPEGLLGGLFELPGGELEGREAPEEGLARQLRERIGLEPKEIRALGEVKHVFSHRVLRLHVHAAELPPGRVRRSFFDAHRWLPPHSLDAPALSAVALSAVARKAVDLAATAAATRSGAKPARRKRTPPLPGPEARLPERRLDPHREPAAERLARSEAKPREVEPSAGAQRAKGKPGRTSDPQAGRQAAGAQRGEAERSRTERRRPARRSRAKSNG